MEILVSQQKILNYLLTDKDKSKFFRAVGYVEENWQTLQADLVALAENHSWRLRQTTIYGDEYEIVGSVLAPDGRTIMIKSGWMMDRDQMDTLKFVTAYPA